MSSSLDVALNSSKILTKDIDSNVKLKSMTNDLDKGVSKAIDNVSKYIIKALPIPDCAKDVLLDVKNALKTKDVKAILSTAVKSSIREGLELLGMNKTTINSVFKLKDVALKGGLGFNLKNSIDVVSKKFLNGNIASEHISSFFKDLKQFVVSNKFVEKLGDILKKLNDKKEKFFEQVKEWYKSYEKMDIDKMLSVANKLKRKKELIAEYPECEKENGVIQNMTTMLTAKQKNSSENKKLSPIQLQLCNTL